MKPVYYLAYHPTDVALYSDFCRFFHRYRPGISQHLIVAAHPNFKHFDCSFLFDLFDEVIYLPNAQYTARLQGLLQDIRYKQHLAQLTFPDDALIMTHALTHTTLPINLLLRHIRQTARRTRVVVIDVTPYYVTMPRPCRTNEWRAWVRHALADFLLGDYRVVGQYRGRQMVHQVYANEEQIVDQNIILSDHFETCPKYVTVKHPGNPGMANHDEKNDDEKISSESGYVFFFGNQRLPAFYPEVDQTTLVNLMNAILSRLTELYANTGTCLFYKPHPHEIGQPILFDLNGFQLFDKPYSAEMIYSVYRNQVRAVYTVYSLSATTAVLYGISSFVFFEMLPFSPSTRAVFQSYLLDTNQVVSVHSLDELKVEEPHLRPVFDDRDADHLLEVLYGN